MAGPPPRSAAAALKPVPPGTPEERALALVSIMDRLAGLMARELDALQGGALERVAALQSEKQGLATRLDEIGRLLRIDRAGLSSLTPELRLRLADAGHRLGEISAASAEAFDIRGRAQRCMVDVAVNTINQERRSTIAYAQCRKGIATPVRRLPPSRSTTFNATL